jgi:hypothetical protein
MGWLFTIRGLVGLQYLAVALCTVFFLPVDFLAIFLETTIDILIFDPVILMSLYSIRKTWRDETRGFFTFLRHVW